MLFHKVTTPGTAPQWTKTFRLLIPGMKAQWLRVLVAGLCLVLSVGLRILEPWPLQYVLDHIISNVGASPQNATQNTTGGTTSVPHALIACALALVLIAVLRALADFYRTVTFSMIGNRVVTELRGRVYEHVQRLSLGFHQRSRGGDLTVRLVGDLNMLKDVAVSAALPLLSSFLLLVGMLSVMLWMEWRLGLIVLCVFPVFWLVALRGSRRIHQSAKKQRRREGALAATAAEALSAVKSVQAMDVGNAFSGSFAAHNSKSHREGVKTSRLTAGLERTVDVLIAAASAIVLWRGATFVLDGQLTPGELVVYLAYLKRGFKPLQDFAKYTGRISKALAAGDRITELLDEQPDVVEHPNAVQAPVLNGHIRFEHVSFGYEAHQPVLVDLSFDVRPGQRLAIVGPSGAGKSTVLSLLLRLYDPVKGQVLIDGTDIKCWTLQSLRQRMSVVLQDAVVFASSVRDNIALAVDDTTDMQVRDAARIAMIDEFIQQLPDGYETALGERGVNLSQGQRQRLAIARAVLRQSPILLLDEPSASLDPANRTNVISALKTVSSGRTTVMITHDMQLAAECDVILCLSGDGTVDLGTHAQLIAESTTYAALCHSAHLPLSAHAMESENAVRC
jgi:ATP-binding cassette, subfamily B, bacterial